MCTGLFSCVQVSFHVYRSLSWEWGITHVNDTRVWYDSMTCVIWFNHMCDMIQSHLCHSSFQCVCVIWLSYEWWYSFLCVSWFILLIPMCVVIYITHFYVWCYSFLCVVFHKDAGRLRACDMTYSSFIWIIHMNDSTHSYLCCDSHVSWEIYWQIARIGIFRTNLTCESQHT